MGGQVPSLAEIEDEFANWYQQAKDALENRDSSYRQKVEIDERLADLKREMRSVESEVLVNGGYEAIQIDGRNDAIRSAQLTQALKAHPGYAALAREFRDSERAEADIAGHIKTWESRFSLARAGMEFTRSRLDWLAAMRGMEKTR